MGRGLADRHRRARGKDLLSGTSGQPQAPRMKQVRALSRHYEFVRGANAAERLARALGQGTQGLTSQTKQVCAMNDPALRDRALSKVPEVTLVFWIIKIAA